MNGTLLRKPWARVIVMVAFWTLIGLSFASQFYISSSKAGMAVSWKQAVSFSLGDWYVFAVLSLPVFHLARRFRIEGRQWTKRVLVHLLASVLFSFLYMVLRATVNQFQGWFSDIPASFSAAFRPLLVKTWHFNLLIYWVIVSVAHAFDYYRESQERELRTVELEKRLVQAKLQALQMQLNPHFLFNTLHAISALVHKDVEAADRMIARLSDLLRFTLESTDAHEVPLRQELSFLERYLEIEQTRFGDRLTVSMQIPAQTLDALVPSLVLQPLVENAIRHGVEPQAKPGRIEILARCRDNTLELQVRDNGAGLPGGQPPAEEGVGLSNTRARLQQLYGAAHSFELCNEPGGGLAALISIPLHHLPARPQMHSLPSL